MVLLDLVRTLRLQTANVVWPNPFHFFVLGIPANALVVNEDEGQILVLIGDTCQQSSLKVLSVLTVSCISVLSYSTLPVLQCCPIIIWHIYQYILVEFSFQPSSIPQRYGTGMRLTHNPVHVQVMLTKDATTQF